MISYRLHQWILSHAHAHSTCSSHTIHRTVLVCPLVKLLTVVNVPSELTSTIYKLPLKNMHQVIAHRQELKIPVMVRLLIKFYQNVLINLSICIS